MFRAFTDIVRIRNPRRFGLFALLAVVASFAGYRALVYTPSPGVDQSKLRPYLSQRGDEAEEQADELFAMFTGGDLNSQSADHEAN